jgi:hypothetical protein
MQVGASRRAGTSARGHVRVSANTVCAVRPVTDACRGLRALCVAHLGRGSTLVDADLSACSSHGRIGGGLSWLGDAPQGTRPRRIRQSTAGPPAHPANANAAPPPPAPPARPPRGRARQVSGAAGRRAPGGAGRVARVPGAAAGAPGAAPDARAAGGGPARAAGLGLPRPGSLRPEGGPTHAPGPPPARVLAAAWGRRGAAEGGVTRGACSPELPSPVPPCIRGRALCPSCCSRASLQAGTPWRR